MRQLMRARNQWYSPIFGDRRDWLTRRSVRSSCMMFKIDIPLEFEFSTYVVVPRQQRKIRSLDYLLASSACVCVCVCVGSKRWKQQSTKIFFWRKCRRQMPGTWIGKWTTSLYLFASKILHPFLSVHCYVTIFRTLDNECVAMNSKALSEKVACDMHGVLRRLTSTGNLRNGRRRKFRPFRGSRCLTRA